MMAITKCTVRVVGKLSEYIEGKLMYSVNKTGPWFGGRSSE